MAGGLNLHISVSQIVAGIIFGVIGMYVFRIGKRNAHFTHLFIGIGLMAYPYFVRSDWATWGIGVALTALAWQLR